jgi:hypothetical protein
MKKVGNKRENLIHCFETLSHGGIGLQVGFSRTNLNLTLVLALLLIFPLDLLASGYNWRNGTGEGSGYYWRNGTGKGSGYYWRNGTGKGSGYYWRNGTGEGSGYYWRNGTGKSFPNDIMLNVCIALDKDDEVDVCEMYPFLDEIK